MLSSPPLHPHIWNGTIPGTLYHMLDSHILFGTRLCFSEIPTVQAKNEQRKSFLLPNPTVTITIQLMILKPTLTQQHNYWMLYLRLKAWFRWYDKTRMSKSWHVQSMDGDIVWTDNIWIELGCQNSISIQALKPFCKPWIAESSKVRIRGLGKPNPLSSLVNWTPRQLESQAQKRNLSRVFLWT